MPAGKFPSYRSMSNHLIWNSFYLYVFYQSGALWDCHHLNVVLLRNFKMISKKNMKGINTMYLTRKSKKHAQWKLKSTSLSHIKYKPIDFFNYDMNLLWPVLNCVMHLLWPCKYNLQYVFLQTNVIFNTVYSLFYASPSII